MDTTTCPQCGALAEVEWRAVLEGTDGPVEHAKVRCLERHWFLVPVSSLAAVSAARNAPSGPVALPLTRHASGQGSGQRYSGFW